MKFIHTADWHLGKKIYGQSMLPDQEFILRQIEAIIKEEEAQALIIAGDVYDRTVPEAEAVRLLDGFLTRVCGEGVMVFLISGNHDSPERLGFGSRLMRTGGLYTAGEWKGETQRIVLSDEYGPLSLYLLPFARTALMNRAMGTAFPSAGECVREAVNRMKPDPLQRSLLVTHHFVTASGGGPLLCESETAPVGTLDNVDCQCFDAFDYVALGHIHGPQWIGEPRFCYAGSPLKYSFSEAGHHKSVTVAEFLEKGRVLLKKRPLSPLHDMRILKGELSELIREDTAELVGRGDYLQALLTDETEPLDAMSSLRAVYPNVLQMVLLKRRLSGEGIREPAGDVAQRGILSVYREFFEAVSGRVLDEEREQVIKDLLREEKGGKGGEKP